jgi:hypothetical protein
MRHAAGSVGVSGGLALALCALFQAACGSSRGSAPRSLLDPTQVLDPAPLVTITASGVSPRVSHASVGVVMRFVNDDRVAHRLVAAPDLGYGDCPEMAALGTLVAGGSGELSLARPQSICAFHDAAGPTNRDFQGLLVLH